MHEKTLPYDIEYVNKIEFMGEEIEVGDDLQSFEISFKSENVSAKDLVATLKGFIKVFENLQDTYITFQFFEDEAVIFSIEKRIPKNKEEYEREFKKREIKHKKQVITNLQFTIDSSKKTIEEYRRFIEKNEETLLQLKEELKILQSRRPI